MCTRCWPTVVVVVVVVTGMAQQSAKLTNGRVQGTLMPMHTVDGPRLQLASVCLSTLTH